MADLKLKIIILIEFNPKENHQFSISEVTDFLKKGFWLRTELLLNITFKNLHRSTLVHFGQRFLQLIYKKTYLLLKLRALPNFYFAKKENFYFEINKRENVGLSTHQNQD